MLDVPSHNRVRQEPPRLQVVNPCRFHPDSLPGIGYWLRGVSKWIFMNRVLALRDSSKTITVVTDYC